jgi:hypothetical protein
MDLANELRAGATPWWPRTAAELVAAHERGDLWESRHLECKRELPKKGDSIARSASGLANHGGAVIYGVAEEPPHSGRFDLAPFALAGAKERVAQVVSSSVHGHLVVDVVELPCDDDPDRGYLVMRVPASPRAPHMVEVKGDRRYYGRHDTVTEPLHGDEVETLMQRRRDAERDRAAWLAAAMRRDVSGVGDPHVGNVDQAGGALTVVAAAVLPPPVGLRRAPTHPRPEELLPRHLTDAVQRWHFRTHYDNRELGLAGLEPRPWLPVGGSYVAAHPHQSRQEPENRLELEVDAQLGVRLRAAGIVMRTDETPRYGPGTDGTTRVWLYEYLVVRHLVRTLAFTASLLTEAGYVGAVDVGVGLTRVARTLSPLVHSRQRMGQHPPAWAGHVDEEYRRTDQVSSTRLADHPDEVARDLLQDLFDALAQGDYPSGQHPIGPRP